MIADLIKGPKAGGSTNGAGIAQIIAGIRGCNVVGVVTEATSALALQEHGVAEIVRVRSLKGAQRAIQAQAGNVVVLDTSTKLYERALRTYRETANEFRTREGGDPDPNIGPAGWSIINERYYDSTVGAAIASGVDLIQVHREGPVYAFDPVSGQVETEGTKTRGAAEGGMHGNLTVVLYGGLRSKYKRVGDRWLYVANDPSGLSTGRLRALEEIRSADDRDALQEMLARLLAKSLAKIISACDADARAWADLSEPEDSWGEARTDSNRDEVKILLDGYRRLFRLYAIDGQSKDERQARADVLQESIGAETLETAEVMYERKPAVLRAGVEVVRQKLEARRIHAETERRQAATAEVEDLKNAIAAGLEAAKPRRGRKAKPAEDRNEP